MIYKTKLFIFFLLLSAPTLFASNDDGFIGKRQNLQGTYSVVVYKCAENNPQPVYSFDSEYNKNLKSYYGNNNVSWPSQDLTIEQISINAALEAGLPAYYFLDPLPRH